MKLTKLFPEYVAFPATIIFNKIIQSKVYPAQWKVEHQIPIPKCILQKQKMTLGTFPRLTS